MLINILIQQSLEERHCRPLHSISVSFFLYNIHFLGSLSSSGEHFHQEEIGKKKCPVLKISLQNSKPFSPSFLSNKLVNLHKFKGRLIPLNDDEDEDEDDDEDTDEDEDEDEDED